MTMTAQRLAYYAVPKGLGFLRAVERQARVHSGGRIPDSAPPVFIVGAPRTGSTLLYQLLTQRFRVGYISNLASLFFKSLYIGVRLHRQAFGDAPHDSFSSDYGRTSGWKAPSECGKFWYQWFPQEPHFVSADDWRPGQYDRLRDTVAAIAQMLEVPFVFKNLTCGQRLQVLPLVFPEARYIFAVRDPLDTAQSILRRRIAHGGDKSEWSSVKPPNYAELARLPYPAQIVGQVYWTERQIQEDLSRLPANRRLTVHYENLCDDPSGELDQIAAFLSRDGVVLRERENATLPSVQRQRARTVSDDDYAALVAEVDRLDWSYLSG
jgi:hypothetical protein